MKLQFTKTVFMCIWAAALFARGAHARFLGSTDAQERKLFVASDYPRLLLQPIANTTKYVVYDICPSANQTNSLACTRRLSTTVPLNSSDTAWRAPPLQPLYLHLYSSAPLEGSPASALTLPAGWAVQATEPVAGTNGTEFLLRVQPGTAANASLYFAAGSVTAQGTRAPSYSSNALRIIHDVTPPQPEIRTGLASGISYRETLYVSVDYGEALLESCPGGACLFTVETGNVTWGALSAYEPDTGRLYIKLQPPRVRSSRPLSLTLRFPQGAARDFSNNSNPAAALHLHYAARPQGLPTLTTVVSQVAGVGVEAAVLTALASNMILNMDGLVRRHSDNSVNAAVKLLGWAQLFAMTSYLQVPALSEEYRSLARKFDWAMLQIGIQWTSLGKSDTAARRLLLTASTSASGNATAAASLASEVLGKVKDWETKADPHAQALIYGYSIAFVGGTVFIIHALILLIAHLINATPPPILLFPRLELYLGLALMPVAGFLVGTSLAAGDYGTSAVVMALYPLPVLAGSTYLLVKVLLLPHPNIRRIFYEVSRGPKVYKKMMSQRRNLPWHRKLINGLIRFPGEWKTLPSDHYARDVLSRFMPLLGGLRGPAACRLGYTYTVNPWTLRVKRGFFEPITDTYEAEHAKGFQKLWLWVLSWGYVLSSFGIVWTVAKGFLMAVLLGYYAQDGKAQVGALLCISLINTLWLVIFHPCENVNDGRRDLVASIVESVGLLLSLALANRGFVPQSPGGYTAMECLSISRAIIATQALALLMHLINVYLSLIRTATAAVQGTIKITARDRLTKAFRTVQQDIAFKKYANRWICAALGRPIRGWPKLSTLGYFERAVVEVLLESYPGNTHRDIRREDTWDSLGVWLLGSCPPPHLLYSLIETAAETKPLWRAFLNGCSSREDAMAKILGLLRGINRSESGMAVGSTDLTSGSFSHGSHGDAGGAKPVSGAPGSDPYSHGMIPVPALMPSPSLYAIPESRPVSGPVAREPLPQQQLLLPGPSVGHSVGLIPEEGENRCDPSVRAAIALDLPTYEPSLASHGSLAGGYAAGSPPQDQPPNPRVQFELPSQGQEEVAQSMDRPQAETDRTRSPRFSGFLSGFMQMMGIDGSDKRDAPEEPPMMEAPGPNDYDNNSPVLGPNHDPFATPYPTQPQEAPRQEEEEEEGGTVLWFLGKKKKKGKGKKEKKQSKKVKPQHDMGDHRMQIQEPGPPDSPPPLLAPASSGLEAVLQGLPEDEAEAVRALYASVKAGEGLEGLLGLDSETGRMTLTYKGARYIIHDGVLEVVVREAEKREKSLAGEGDMLGPVPQGFFSRLRQNQKSIRLKKGAAAAAAAADAGHRSSNGGPPRPSARAPKAPGGHGWGFFWGDRRDQHGQMDESDVISLDDQPTPNPGPNASPPRPPRVVDLSKAWTPDRQVGTDIDSTIAMAQRLRELSRQAQRRRAGGQ